MPEAGSGHTFYRAERRINEALDEIADRGLVELMRRDAAVRVLVVARRLSLISQPPAAVTRAETEAGTLVQRVTGGWDPMAMTAAEYADSLGVAALDGFLLASRSWAAEQRRVPAMAAQARAA